MDPVWVGHHAGRREGVILVYPAPLEARRGVGAADKGGEVQLDVFEGLHHVFQGAVKDLPSAVRALDAVGVFLSRHWAK